MISVSAEALELMQDGRPFVYECLFTLADGTQFTLTEDDMQTGCRINAPSGSSSLPLGCAISRCLELSFFNTEDQYADYDFFGATIAVTARLQLSDSIEIFDLGLFTVTEPETYGRTISIAAYDAFYKADRTYTTNRTFPMTAGELFTDACDKSSLLPYTSVFRNSDYIVQKKPENMSCRQVIGYCAMLACGNAVVDGNEVKIIDYTQAPQQAFDDPIRQTLALSDVVVTGVAYSNGTETTTLGTSGYILTVSNPLFEGNELDALQRMYNALNGFTFRPFELTIPAYPFAQSFDACTVYDREIACNTYVTDIQFNFKGATTLKCSADSPIRNNSKSYTSNVATVQKLREMVVEERGLRERVEEDLSQRLDNASGFYTTTERTQSDGYIYYIHDKPTMAESQKVWMMTENAWGVSSDGGQTWNAGLTVDGVLLAKILSAEGISADWITSGRLEITQNGTPIFYADKDTGSVYISGDNVFIGGQPATEALAELSGALTITLSNEMQGIPVDGNGDYAEFPSTTTDVRVVYGSQDVTADATLTHGTFNVTGSIVYNSSGNKYIYTATGLSADTGYVVFNATYNNGTTTVSASKRFNLYKAYAGKDGPAGIARVYFVEPTASIVKQGIDDSHFPESVTFYSWYREGTSATRYAYPALFRIEVLRENASEWETVIEPTENKASETYTIEDADITSVKCTLLSYADFNDVWWGLSPDGSAVFLVDDDGNMLEIDHTIEVISGGEQIDIATVPVVKDISGLTQDKVFDILTDGGNLQGLWYLNGNVYFNASYISTGILRSSNGGTYWNLDTGELVLSPTAKVGTTSSAETLSGIQGRITTNANKIQTEVTDRTNAVNSLSSRITQNATSIETEVSNRKSADNSLSSRITQNATSITTEVSDRKSADNSLSSRIQQNADSISLRVTAAQAQNIASSEILANIDGIRLQTTKALAWSATNSSLTTDGTLTARNGNFSGMISSTTITGSSIRNDNSTSYALLKDGTLDIWRNVASLTNVRVLQLTVVNGYSHQALTGTELTVDSSSTYPRNYENYDFDETGTLPSQAALYTAHTLHVFRVGSTNAAFMSKTDTYVHGYFTVEKNAYVKSNLYVNGIRTYGTKSRTIRTEDYGQRLLYAYETPTPLFGDVGDGVIGEDGLCYIQIEPTFLETVKTSQYQVFLQAYGDGKCYVKERKSSYFIVAGDPGLEFGWEMKARQIDFAQHRLERDDPDVEIDDTNYGDDFSDHIKETTVDYGAIAEAHIEEVNKERIPA